MILLLRISQHRLLAKTVKTIYLNLASLRDSKEDYTFRLKEQGRNRTRALRAQNRDHRQQYDRLVQDEQRFRMGPDYFIMIEILFNFIGAGNCPAIVMGVYGTDRPRKPWDLRRLIRKLGYRDCLTYRQTDERPFENLWCAILDTKYPVTQLGLGNSSSKTIPDGLCTPLSIFANFRTDGCFRHLRTLYLTVPQSELKLVDGEIQGFERTERDLIGLLGFVTEVEHLRRLNLLIPSQTIGSVRFCDYITLDFLFQSRMVGLPDILLHIEE
ncbi:hypothetical protein LTR85_005916 [Meristemomyces frigidus]|nr:hypothetical protein LTR85_005916 [Meristemomyces frigidus]